MDPKAAKSADATRQSRVALVRCETYEPEAVHAAVGRGLEFLGGADRFVAPGERIVLKPNLLVASTPEKAVTTHPSVFGAVARHLLDVGAELSWGDSPGFGMSMGVARRAGLAEVADALGMDVAEFGKGRTVSFAKGEFIKQFTLAEGVLDADGLVSLPKMKTHALTRMTGAIKNQFGCIPGMLKGEFHARMPDDVRFSQMLVDLNRLIRPRLVVMDGIVAMEGNGPRNGDPRQMSVLVLSDDPVAVDATACRMMALDPGLVETVVWGERWGLGSATAIELRGDALSSFIAPEFVVNRRPGSTTGGQGRGSRVIRNLIVPKPSIDADRCTACGTCVKVCPVDPKAVDFVGEGDGRSRIPVHDYSRCIRCYCCQEMCPERAIGVSTPLLGRVLHPRRKP